LTFFNWRDNIGTGGVVTIACILYLFSHRFLFFFIALLANIVHIFDLLPYVANHIFYEWLMNLTLFFITLFFLLKSRRANQSAEELDTAIWEKMMPVGRISLIILYFYVVFHKLNSDFFEPKISCAGIFFEDVIHNFYLHKISFIKNLFLEYNLGIRTISIYFTLISEALIPVLLSFKKTRNTGLIYGAVFHLILPFQGFTGIYSFSAMIYTSYVFFWGIDAFEKFYAFIKKNRIFIGTYFTVAVILVMYFRTFDNWSVFNAASTFFWFVYSIIYLLLFYKTVNIHITTTKYHTGTPLKLGILWLSPVIVFMNGLLPYVGLKTEDSYGMFSNIKTEGGGTNHHIVPVSSQVFNYQKEVVTVIDSDNEIFYRKDWAKNDVHLVLFEFIRLLNDHESDFRVKFEVNEKEYTVVKYQGAFVETSGLDLHQGYLIRKFFRFRPIYPTSSLCQH
jgi:hypothetical protein